MISIITHLAGCSLPITLFLNWDWDGDWDGDWAEFVASEKCTHADGAHQPVPDGPRPPDVEEQEPVPADPLDPQSPPEKAKQQKKKPKTKNDILNDYRQSKSKKPKKKKNKRQMDDDEQDKQKNKMKTDKAAKAWNKRPRYKSGDEEGDEEDEEDEGEEEGEKQDEEGEGEDEGAEEAEAKQPADGPAGPPEAFCHSECGALRQAQSRHSALCDVLRGALSIEDTLRQLRDVKPQWGDSDLEMRPQQQYNAALAMLAELATACDPAVTAALHGKRMTPRLRELLFKAFAGLPGDAWMEAARSPVDAMLHVEGQQAPNRRLTARRQGALVTELMHLIDCATAETESQIASVFFSGQVMATALLVACRHCVPGPQVSASNEDSWDPDKLAAFLSTQHVAALRVERAKVRCRPACLRACLPA